MMFLEEVQYDASWMHLQIWQFVVIIVVVILAVAVATFILTRKLFQRELKKNPPVNEAMIRAMFQQMGRTPSEKQVRAVMRSMDEAKEKDEAKKKEAERKKAAKEAREQRKKEGN